MYSQTILLLLTGLVLGMRHAFDRDHILAVTHFISIEPDPIKSAWFGLRWAAGHTLTVLALGSLILLLHLKLDPTLEKYAEVAVGFSLVVLALWRLFLLLQEARHTHLHSHKNITHKHPHSHAKDHEHVHRHAPTMVGMVHGASGAFEIFVIIPISLMASITLTYIYLALFSLGCAGTMSVYGYLAGKFYHRASEKGKKIYRTLVILTSGSGLILGIVWIVKNV